VKKALVNLSASVRQRLLNLATDRKEDFGLVLSRYGLERFLYRLSVSSHRDSFVLKGALRLQVWTGESYRPTRDLDLLGKGRPNLSYQKIFSKVCSQDIEDDGPSFLSQTIRVERIRDEEAYEGVRACHAGGRGFESRRSRQSLGDFLMSWFFREIHVRTSVPITTNGGSLMTRERLRR